MLFARVMATYIGVQFFRGHGVDSANSRENGSWITESL